ncbi:MAG: hypothetical protein AAF723_00355 [Pseudomonadota bacterium]
MSAHNHKGEKGGGIVQRHLPLPTAKLVIPYCEGASNQHALQILQGWVRQFDEDAAAPSLVMGVTGPKGSGKTRLLQETKAQLEAQSRSCLVMDDAHDQDATTLFNLYNEAILHEHPLVLAGEGRIENWGKGEALPDLISRLSALPIAYLEAPDEALLAKTLFNGLSQVGIHATAAQTEEVAKHLQRRFGAVEAIINTSLKILLTDTLSVKALLLASMKENQDHML